METLENAVFEVPSPWDQMPGVTAREGRCKWRLSDIWARVPCQAGLLPGETEQTHLPGFTLAIQEMRRILNFRFFSKKPGHLNLPSGTGELLFIRVKIKVGDYLSPTPRHNPLTTAHRRAVIPFR
jgi:hypothetical protein